MDTRVILILSAEAVLAMALLYASGVLKKPGHAVLSAVLIAAAFVLRGLMLNHETSDYQQFLTQWVQYFADNGGFSALKEQIGNYNIPYLYFLAWFSYSDIRDLYLIKLLSIFFDVVLAWASMQLVGRFTGGVAKRLWCFFTVLFLPTVLLNGAYWGQCDSIYAAFGVLSIYLALSDRPWLSMAAIAVSFGFKLQAVFVMPVFAVLLITKKIKLRHFLMFPLAYVVLVLPAVLMGRPFLETVTLYFGQTGSIGQGLNYNSSSIFSIIKDQANVELWSKAGIIAAFAAMLIIFAVIWARRRRATDSTIMAAAVLLSLIIPFLLPHMHDRYFFAADVLTLILACMWTEWLALPCLVQFGSLLGYHAYLRMEFLLPMKFGGYAMLLAVALAVVFLSKSFYKTESIRRVS